jgi:hypothetical protein
VVIADDQMTANDAYGLACQGTALLWRGDFQNASIDPDLGVLAESAMARRTRDG